MIGVGAALLVAAVCVVLYAFHSRGHNVLGAFTTNRVIHERENDLDRGLADGQKKKASRSIIQTFNTITGRGQRVVSNH
jgi:hypothetical protein